MMDLLIPVAPTPVSIEGKRHLVYELHLTNFGTSDVVVTRVQVKDGGRKTPLADYRDSELAERLGRPGVDTELHDKRLLSGGLRAVVYLWLALDDEVATPTWLQHRIEFDVIRPSGRDHGAVEGAATPVRREQPVVLGPPLRGGPWVALYDPWMARGHRRAIYTIGGRARIPARFAIDWIRLDHEGSPARGDKSRVASWYGYGAEVLAVECAARGRGPALRVQEV
jgi:hypothetical protein